MSTWPQQVNDLSAEDYDAMMERLLKGLKPAVDEKVAIRRLIKERLWLADVLRKQGNYNEAIDYYGGLIQLVYDEATGELSDAEIWYLSKAFIDYVDCGRFSLKLPLLEQAEETEAMDTRVSIKAQRRLEHLLKTAEKGRAWLEAKGRQGWAAGLLLEHALLLKSQGKSDEALCELKEASRSRESSMEAPGYSLFTHKLELAELLYASAIGEKDDKLGEAANLVSAIPSDSKSTLNERRLACLMLAKIRQRAGEQDTANAELGKAQQFLYEMERATIAEHSHQLLDSAHQEAEKLARTVIEVKEALEAVKSKALESITVAPATGEAAATASSSNEAISLRHIACYVSLPHLKQDDIFYQMVLLPVLRNILECEPFYWQVGYREDKLDYQDRKCSDCPAGKNAGKGDRDCWLKCADVYIADIEGWSPDVFAELGIIYAMRTMRTETRLSIILGPDPGQQGKYDSATQYTVDYLHDFGEVIPLPDDFKLNSALPVEDSIKLSFGKVKEYLYSKIVNQGFLGINKKPREHYLSPVWIEMKCKYTEKNITETISRKYITMEAFRDALKGTPGSTTSRRVNAAANKLTSWGITTGIIENILKEVTTVLKEDSE